MIKDVHINNPSYLFCRGWNSEPTRFIGAERLRGRNSAVGQTLTGRIRRHAETEIRHDSINLYQ
jgi:hypothetical protein